MVYTGETPEDVLSIIKSDIYAESGVWDLEKTQIIPVSVPLPVSIDEGDSRIADTFLSATSTFLRFGNHCQNEEVMGRAGWRQRAVSSEEACEHGSP